MCLRDREVGRSDDGEVCRIARRTGGCPRRRDAGSRVRLNAGRAVTVQFPFSGIVRLLKLNDVAPAAKTFVDTPAQVPPAAPPTAVIFESVSVNDAPVSVPTVLPFDKVSVTTDCPPTAIDAGAKALAIVAAVGMLPIRKR